MTRSPEAASKAPATRRASARRVAALFLAAVTTLATTSFILERLPPNQPASFVPPPVTEPEPEDHGPYGMEPTELYEIYLQELARMEQTDREEEATTEDPAEPGRDAERPVPTTLRVSSLEIDTEVTKVGDDGEGLSSALIPSDSKKVGWYKPGPSPGEVGNAVLLASVDDAPDGDAGFAKLSELRLGDEIEVDREGGDTARFVVDGIRLCPPHFPVRLAHDPATEPILHLVNCGGSDSDDALKRVIVSATLAAEPNEEPTGESDEEEETAEEEKEADADDTAEEQGDDQDE